MDGMLKQIKNRTCTGVLIFLCMLVWLPVLLLAAASVMPEDEMLFRYLSPLGIGKDNVRAAILPSYLSIKSYGTLLFQSPGFFVMFWNSCIQVFPLLLGQVLVGIPAAWALARYSFRGRAVIAAGYLLLFLLPFQVTQVSAYLVLSRIGILDTHLAIILPGIWSAFPVILMSRFFQSIPESILEAARLEGAGEVRILAVMGIPLGKAGILAVWMLGFFGGWNNIEQPVAYLKERSLWPLALYLPEITAQKAEVAFAAGMMALLPSVLVYRCGREGLEQGIVLDGIKD